MHGIELKEGNNQQNYDALGSLVRDYVTRTWLKTNKKYNKTGEKQVYYFSMEFLLGRLLGDTLLNDDLVNGKYHNDKDKFRSIYENLITYNDEFFVLQDFDPYLKAQNKVDTLYRDANKWQMMCGINIAHSGIFSSDRTIEEYATGIWGSEVIYKNL